MIVTRPCPHCGQPVRDEYTHCPFCGTDAVTGKRTPSVGTDTDGWDEPTERDEKVKTGAVMGCVTAGAVFVIAAAYRGVARTVWVMHHWHGAYRPAMPETLLWIQTALPLALVGGWFLLAHRRAPAFARGLGYSLVVSTALALGAIAVCR